MIVLKLENSHIEESFIKLGSYICAIYLAHFPVFPVKAFIEVHACGVAVGPNIFFSDIDKVEKNGHRVG